MQDYNQYTQNSLAEEHFGSEPAFRDTRKHKSNNMLLIITIMLATVAIVVSAAALILLADKDSDPDNKKTEESITQKESDEELSVENEKSAEEPEEEEVQYIPETMYANCNTTPTLRSGPGTDYSKLADIPAGDSLICNGPAKNGFSKVSYNGIDGYASSEFLSYTKPYVWYYNEEEVEDFVRDVLYAYVDSINTNDVDVLTQYERGAAVTDTIKNHPKVKKTVDSELVLSVNCYGTKRISRTRVTVIRESTIRVYKYDGTQHDAIEKYLTTVENTGDGMYVIEYAKMK